jgi:hypothetical protein
VSSSDVAAGLALVKKWAAASAKIRLSLRVNGLAQATFVGHVASFTDDKVFVDGGASGSGFVDLSHVVDARDVLTEEGLRQRGLSPESEGESVTFSLAMGSVDVNLVGLPSRRPSFRPAERLPS